MKDLKHYIFLIFGILISLLNSGCDRNLPENNFKELKKETKHTITVTFIELGSVRCIPCQQMQPVMKSIESKYPDQVKVVFYDIWTPEGKPFADLYKIKVIPTQVFLDEKGIEYFRHEGFFPEEELVKVLKQKGVK